MLKVLLGKSPNAVFFLWKNILSKTHSTVALNNQNRTLDLWNGIQGTLSVPFKLFNITHDLKLCLWHQQPLLNHCHSMKRLLGK